MSIEITSPTEGATLGGTVQVTYVVTAPADAPLGHAWRPLPDHHQRPRRLLGWHHGPALLLPARARVEITSAPKAVQSGRTVTVKARASAPRRRPLLLEFFHNGRWHFIGAERPNPTGVAAWHFLPSIKQTLRLRVTRPAGDGLLATSSGAVQVRQR